MAARTTAPGGGVSAAHTAALAAALTAMAGRFADTAPQPLTGSDEMVLLAERLRDRASALADADMVAYAGYVQARRSRSPDLEAALDAAVDVPLELTRIGAEVAELARRLATDGNPRLRGDAATGCWLGAAAASSAAVLVAENLAARPGDPRITRAREAAMAARAAATALDG